MNILAVIPARYASTRLPGKPLVSIGGKPMIERVWERARRASLVSKVIVATDDERILQAVSAFGGIAVRTRTEHRSGKGRTEHAHHGDHARRRRAVAPLQLRARHHRHDRTANRR